SLGRNDKAIEYFEQALAIYRELKNRDGEGHALYSLGWAYGRLNRPDKAIEYYEQALAINREVKSRFNEGNALSSLGNAYRNLGRYEKAIEYSEQALAIAREIKARGREIDPLVNLGSVYRSQTQYEKATKFHEQALAIAREVKQKNSEAWVLSQMMLDWKARNQPPLAVFFGKQSVNAYQEIRGNLSSLDRESQQSYLKSKETTYRQLADLLIGQGRLPEAEQVIRILKEEEYFDFVRRDSDDLSKGGKTQLTPEEITLDKRYREILDTLAELGTERGTLIDKKSRTPEEDLRLAKLDTDLVVAGNEFQKFLDGLAVALGTSGDASVKVFQLRESQGLMEDLRELGQGVVALYTLIGEDKYRVILTTADFQKGYEYPIKAADLNRKVLEFREALQNPKLDPLPLAQELYKILLGPVAKDLAKARTQTVMWSLDGVLRYLPVSALNDGKHYLVEQYQNVVFTPASQARLKDVPSRNWNALGLGVTKAHGDGIPALPGVVEEMRGIIRETGAAAQGGVLPGTIKLDEAFTQEAMLSGLRQRPPVVHVASHFQFSPGNETNSALLLGDGTFLSLAQIKSLPNVFGGVELLTLSACNTATGGTGANGKEVEGFGVLAQRQGAKAVVASLWPVADRSTKSLMQEFYRLREARGGQTKAAALREAQLKLLRGEITIDTTILVLNRQIVHDEEKPGASKQPRFNPDPKRPYAHPYYWAPFILIGNWR
ncbi:MAG: CHAT domain-containing protein, partial [Pyrinomonadaceae bacterium]